MDQAAKQEMANVLINSALEATSKKQRVTISQVLHAIAEDAQSGFCSEITKTFMQFRTLGEQFIQSGKAHEFLLLA